MPYAVRVRIYRGNQMEAAALAADTDPDLGDGEPGAELVAELADVLADLVELCQTFHGPDVRLLGFSAMFADVRLKDLQGRLRAGAPLHYSHAYTVLLATTELRRATDWRAQVDITLSP